jgi:hypothetical protein
MSEDVRPHRLRPVEEAVITPAEATELQRLYDELPDAAAAAVEALRFATATPTAAALQRFRERAARVNQITDRINAILG